MHETWVLWNSCCCPKVHLKCSWSTCPGFMKFFFSKGTNCSVIIFQSIVWVLLSHYHSWSPAVITMISWTLNFTDVDFTDFSNGHFLLHWKSVVYFLGMCISIEFAAFGFNRFSALMEPFPLFQRDQSKRKIILFPSLEMGTTQIIASSFAGIDPKLVGVSDLARNNMIGNRCFH